MNVIVYTTIYMLPLYPCIVLIHHIDIDACLFQLCIQVLIDSSSNVAKEGKTILRQADTNYLCQLARFECEERIYLLIQVMYIYNQA